MGVNRNRRSIDEPSQDRWRSRLSHLRWRSDTARYWVAGRLAPDLVVADSPLSRAATAHSSEAFSRGLSHHDLLARLHELVKPRTYVEIGVGDGASLSLSRARTLAIDPAFSVVHGIDCTLRLVRSTSDEFFQAQASLSPFSGLPVDLAFIDGLHLAEYAARDFVNIEKLSGPATVVVVDDTLPRRAIDASRGRRTRTWNGDVFKLVQALRQLRPDLAVVDIDTVPTGTTLVLGLNAESPTLESRLSALTTSWQSPDPQVVPKSVRQRSGAINPRELLQVNAWKHCRFTSSFGLGSTARYGSAHLSGSRARLVATARPIASSGRKGTAEETLGNALKR